MSCLDWLVLPFYVLLYGSFGLFDWLRGRGPGPFGWREKREQHDPERTHRTGARPQGAEQQGEVAEMKVNVELGIFGAFALLDILHGARQEWEKTNQANVIDHLIDGVAAGLEKAGVVSRPDATKPQETTKN